MNVADMRFPDGMFDRVLCFSSIEHWNEKGATIAQGIYEINRVLKVGGEFVVTCPLHIHGHPAFIQGDTQWILSHFDSRHWDIRTDEWRRDHEPLPPYFAWSRYKHLKNLPSSWTLEINATKTSAMDSPPRVAEWVNACKQLGKPVV
jgi:SAM-dependent methyltransferase